MLLFQMRIKIFLKSIKKFKVFKKVDKNFYYNSKNNKDFLNGNSLRKYLKTFSNII